MNPYLILPAILFFYLCLVAPAEAAEVVQLNSENWDSFVPQGKEVDAIYGDYVIRNRHLVAVIARPISGRNANVGARNVAGGIIDLTVRGQVPEDQNDQLVAYYPDGQQFPYRQGEIVQAGSNEVALRVTASGGVDRPRAEVTYRLAEDSPFVLVESVYTNISNRVLTVELLDQLRAEYTFEKTSDGEHELFWVYDKWFGQAYGILPDAGRIHSQGDTGNRVSEVRFEIEGRDRWDLAPGEKQTLIRRIFPARNLLNLHAISRQIQGLPLGSAMIEIREEGGEGVAVADIRIFSGSEPMGHGRCDSRGNLMLRLPPGTYRAEIESLGRGDQQTQVIIPSRGGKAPIVSVSLPRAARVRARIQDEKGGPIPCKVEFHGIDGTPDPVFGPDSGTHGVGNLYYSANGRWTQVLPAGRYRVLISHGPEYDAVYRDLEVAPSRDVSLEATLKRVVQTTGWVSADFHSHSSPSGDNTSSQLGRVLNILAEHIEFAPCTEHNRLSSYTPHLKQLKAEHLLGTTVGIELTGSPGSLNHQNAFPIILKPRTQDYGGPVTHEDPAEQIRRLALWDDESEKLVQVNHPDLGEMFFDRDADGERDGGISGMFQYIDVLEVHPHYVGAYRGHGADTLALPPTFEYRNHTLNNRIFNWLQLLNQGHRIPGVVNTDSHYNFHGSGWIRNYLRSPTDDPAKIKPLDIVRAAEGGHLVMTNGPFMEVSLSPRSSDGQPAVGPGADLDLPDGQGLLNVRVQCANWLDVDRVQVLVNGRPEESLNFTRWTHPGSFGEDVVKFSRTIPLDLEGDAHIIVAAVGEKSTLGPVVGPVLKDAKPAAISNPIFVHVDGNGFKANGDTLGSPLPVKSGSR